MGRKLKRKLFESKIAGKKFRCCLCDGYIFKGESYTQCAITGIWGGYHDNCFKNISISLETENMKDAVVRKVEIENSRKLEVIINSNGKEVG